MSFPFWQTIRCCFAWIGCAFVIGTACASASTQSNEIETVRVGLVRLTTPSPYAPIVNSTIKAIRQSLSDYRVEVVRMKREDLEQAIIGGKIDLFLSSAGFYRRLVGYGANSLASAMSPRYPNPNFSEGAAIVVSNLNRDLQTISSLQGKRVVIPSTQAFSSYQIPMGEVVRRGYDPDRFFSKIIQVGDGEQAFAVFDVLNEGKADVAFAKQCILEDWLKTHPEAGKKLRVIEPRHAPGECARSTDLFPTWTLGSTFVTPPDVSRRVASAVLNMPATTEGLLWGVATDFSRVDQLLRDLKIGPYEHLRHWTLRQFLMRFWPLLLASVMLIIGLAWYTRRIEHLVQIRTKALEEALSKQRQLQSQAMKATQRLNSLQKVAIINQISSILAHELRHPLGAIIFYADGLIATLKDGLSNREQTLKVLSQISAQAMRISEVMQKVRSYRKGSTGINDIICISNIVAESIQIVRHSTADREVTIDTVIDPNLIVRGDALEIGILAINLIKNAVEVTRELPNAHVRVSLRESIDGIRLCIEDNGTIRTEQDLVDLRERIDSTKEDGLGLGLQIVGGIAERHQAKIVFGLRSDGGQGLVVSVTFPKESCHEH